MLSILIIGLLVTFAGLAMVLAAAFGRRTAWGLAILVLPFIYPLYAILNWSSAPTRNGFLMSIAGGLIVFAALYGGAGRELPFNEGRRMAATVPTALPAYDPLPNEAAANAVVLPPGEKFDPLVDERYGRPASPLSPRSDRPVFRVPPAREYAYYRLDIAHIGASVGKRLKIVTRAGKIREGVLVGSGPKSLLLETPRAHGRAAFEYRLSDLAAIYVYQHELPAARTTQEAAPPEYRDDEVGVDKLVPADNGWSIEPVTPGSARNELEVGSDIPDAVLDLPVWAVPDAENRSREMREPALDEAL